MVPWCVLFLFEIGGPTSPRPTFLYGCMAQGAEGWVGARPTEQVELGDGILVRQVRTTLHEGAAQAVLAALRGSSLDFALFGDTALADVEAVRVDGARRSLQPEQALSSAGADRRHPFGVPPGFLSAPTVVESFFAPGWLPPAPDPARLVRESTRAGSGDRARMMLDAMSELSGLPFRRSYVERVRCFEVMSLACLVPGPSVGWRAVRGPGRGPVEAVEVEVVDRSATQVHIAMRRDGETFLDRLHPHPAATSAPITIAVDGAPQETEVRVFDADTGELRAHRLFAPYLSIGINSSLQSGRAELHDEVSRRAPLDRRGQATDVSRVTAERRDVRSKEAEDSDRRRHASRMRELAGDRAELYHEWFPRGIGGELDVIERLRCWAEDPSTEEVVIADPFTSPETLTRLVRRIRRENVGVTFVCSLGAEDPDDFGKRLDAVALLRSSLDEHEAEFACGVRVVNVTEQRGATEGADKRPGRQAFHDRYLVLVGRDGSRRAFTISNSLNKASGNWPFVLAELRADVGASVDAYVRGLMGGQDLARDLALAVDLDWTNDPRARRKPRRSGKFGFRLCEASLRTLAWLAGDAAWAGPPKGWPGSSSRARSEVRRLLSVALRARLVARCRGRIELAPRQIGMVLDRFGRSRMPRSPRRLAVVLRGLGEIGAWSDLSPSRVAAAFRGIGMRMLLPRVLEAVASQVPLRARGSGEVRFETWDTSPLGRRLIWATDEALDWSQTPKSPDYGLTGAIRAASHVDAEATLSFLTRTDVPVLRGIAIALVHEDLGASGRGRLLPAAIRSRSLPIRVAAVLHLLRPVAEGGAGLDAGGCQTRLLEAGCTPESRLAGAIVAYERAAFEVGRARATGRPIGDLARAAVRAAAVVGSAWPPTLPDPFLDVVVETLDWSGEKVVKLAEGISDAGGDASGLHRRLLKQFDEAVGLPAFEAPDAASRDRALDHGDRVAGPGHDLSLWAAVSYLRLTGDRPVTKLAARYLPLLNHCERQAHDPLFRAFRDEAWRDRTGRLMRVYSFVFRILDEARSTGHSNGVDHFERDVAGRAGRLLGAFADEPRDGADPDVAMLARDLARSRLSGAYASSKPITDLVSRQLTILEAAGRADFDPTALETFVASLRREPLGAPRPAIAAFADVVRLRARGALPIDGVIACWDRVCAAMRIPRDTWAAMSEDAAEPSRLPDPLERQLGVRIAPVSG